MSDKNKGKLKGKSLRIIGICTLSKLSTKPGEIRVILRDSTKLIREHQDETRGEDNSRDSDK